MKTFLKSCDRIISIVIIKKKQNILNYEYRNMYVFVYARTNKVSIELFQDPLFLESVLSD